MKGLRVICIITALMMLTTAFAFGETEAKKLTLKDLGEILIKESPEIRQIEITEKLNKVQYEQNKKDYKDLKKNIEDSETAYINMKTNLNNIRTHMAKDSPMYDVEVSIAVNLLDQTEKFYKTLLKQELSLFKGMESMMLLGIQATQKREQEIEKQKYTLQKDYLNIVYLTEQRNLMNSKFENLKKDIEVEKVRRDISLSTDFYIENMENQAKTIAYNISQMDISIEASVEALKTKLGYSIEDELILDLKIEQLGNPRPPYSLSRMYDSFNQNNLDLALMRSNTEAYKKIVDRMLDVFEEDDLDLQRAVLSYEEDFIKLIKLERTYETAVKQSYYQYLKTYENHQLQIDNKQIAEEKYRHAEAQYKAGLISQRQLDNQKLDLEQFMLDFNKSLIDLTNIRTEIDLISRGIL